MPFPFRAPRLGRPRALALAALSLHAASVATPTLHAQQPAVDRLRRDIAYLVDSRLAGRRTGTPGNDSAAAYIAATYAGLGLRPLSFDSASQCVAARAPIRCFLQPFTARHVAVVADGSPEIMLTQNVAALVRGRDAALRGQVIVVGAHFDHLGRSPVGALDPEAKNAMRPGADDNASGTAAVMELARAFASRPTRRSVIFANFSGEELGQLGSEWFVQHAPVALDSVVAMINFDMVG
ncbi:MAG TPA: M28 family peptidase, partial [Gemmatimonadaceae bacterium]